MDEVAETTPFSDHGSDDPQKCREGGRVKFGFWQAFFISFGTFSGYAGTVLMTAMIYSGWAGVLLFLVMALMSTYSSDLLARCWNLTDGKWRHERHPFGALAFEAYGEWARIAANLLVGLICYVSAIALILIVADMAYIMLGPSAHGTFCYLPLAFGLVVCPFIWLGTPKDNWLVGALSTASCTLGFVFLFISGVTHLVSPPVAQEPAAPVTHLVSPPVAQEPAAPVTHPSSGWNQSLVVVSTLFMLFIHFTIPVTQRDMDDPKEFNKSVVAAFAAYLLLFIPTFMAVHLAYANLVPGTIDVEASVLLAIPRDAPMMVSSLLLLVHSLLVIVPGINPLLQHMEELLSIPEEFGWRRVAFRTAFVLSVVFCAETVPQFSVVLSVLAGVLNPPLAFLVPAALYLRLRRNQPGDVKPMQLRLETAICIFLVVVTPVLMVVITVVTIQSIANGETPFVSPCYINATAAHA